MEFIGARFGGDIYLSRGPAEFRRVNPRLDFELL